MSGQLDRPKLTRAVLENYNIYYHEKIYQRDDTTPELSMPNHVNKLREALLDISGVRIPDAWESFFQDDAKNLRQDHQHRKGDTSKLDLLPPTSTYISEKTLQLLRADWQMEKARLESNVHTYKGIAIEVRKLDYDVERGWMNCLRKNFFKDFESKQILDDDDEYVHFDEFCLVENVLWEESKRAFQWKENFTPGIRQRTGPKPDLSYGFKASQSSYDHQGLKGINYFRNLSFEVLGELRARSPAILSTVTTGLAKWHQWRTDNRNKPDGGLYQGKLMTPEFLCFPWAVVEVKHAQGRMSDEEYCQFQLANATACAYDLQERLIRSVDDSGDVDPIIGFTCIGPRVRLWLTYRGDDGKIHMVCVWATSVDRTWGALCLTEVITNTRVWATRILRGKIVQYIDLAYRRATPTTRRAMRDSGTDPGTPIVDSTPRTSSTATTITGDRDGKIQVTGATSIAERHKSKKKSRIRVKLPPATDSKSTTVNKSSASNILPSPSESNDQNPSRSRGKEPALPTIALNGITTHHKPAPTPFKPSPTASDAPTVPHPIFAPDSLVSHNFESSTSSPRRRLLRGSRSDINLAAKDDIFARLPESGPSQFNFSSNMATASTAASAEVGERKPFEPSMWFNSNWKF